MSETKAWIPWRFYWDDVAQRWKREMKDIKSHPVVLELMQDAQFVELARTYAWSKTGPTATPQTNSNWPPGTTAHQGIAEYWYAVMERNRMNAGPGWVDPTDFDELVARAKLLAAANPLLVF